MEDTSRYIEAIETEIGLRQPPAGEQEVEDEPPRKSAVVSAPVSREATSVVTGKSVSPSRVTLTPQEAEAARIAGVDPKDYARQLLRLREEKKQGRYTHG